MELRCSVRLVLCQIGAAKLCFGRLPGVWASLPGAEEATEEAGGPGFELLTRGDGSKNVIIVDLLSFLSC